MRSVPVYVGLDYHQGGVQVCVLDREGKQLVNKEVANDAGKIMAVAKARGKVKAVAVEACCGAANLADELTALGWKVNMAHPGYTNRMKQNPDKTDFSDARLLADLVRVGYLPTVYLAPEAIRQLRRLVRRRQCLVEMRKAAKLRIRALLRDNRLCYPETPDGVKPVRPWTIAWMKWVETTTELRGDDRWLMDEHLSDLKHATDNIRKVEARLTQFAEGDVVTRKLMTFANVGLVTAVTIRAEIDRFDRFKNGKQLAKFCGVTPRNASSGDRQADAGLIRSGNPGLRKVLVELGHRLCHGLDTHWSKMAARMLIKGKKKNVVVAAVANRWVRWLHHQMLTEDLAG